MEDLYLLGRLGQSFPASRALWTNISRMVFIVRLWEYAIEHGPLNRDIH